MSEFPKDQKFYPCPPALPPSPIPLPPKKIKESTNIFIENPKSLPTDLRQYQVPRHHHEMLKLMGPVKIGPYQKLKLKPVKDVGRNRKLPYKITRLYSTARLPENYNRHSMLIDSKKRKLREFKRPLKVIRKEVSLYKKSDGEELTKGDRGGKDASKIEDDPKKVHTMSNADIKNIAPHGGAARNKQNMFKKKILQVFDHNPELRAIRNREALPWVIEDGEGKEQLMGKFEDSSRATYVAFHINKEGFHIKPINRLYKFENRPPTKDKTLEEAENDINLKSKKNKRKSFEQRLATRNIGSSKNVEEEYIEFKMRAVDNGNDDQEEDIHRDRNDDMEELDFEEPFQDDEEGGLAEMKDDGAKEDEERVKKSLNRLNPKGYFEDEDDIKEGAEEKDPILDKYNSDDEGYDGKSENDDPNILPLNHDLIASIKSSADSDVDSDKGGHSNHGQNLKRSSSPSLSLKGKKVQKGKTGPLEVLGKPSKVLPSAQQRVQQKILKQRSGLAMGALPGTTKPIRPSPLSQSVTSANVQTPSRPQPSGSSLPRPTASTLPRTGSALSKNSSVSSSKAPSSPSTISIPSAADIVRIVKNSPTITMGELFVVLELNKLRVEDNNMKKELIGLIRSVVHKHQDGRLEIQDKYKNL